MNYAEDPRFASLVDAAAATLARAARDLAPVAFASSFDAEGMVLLDLIAEDELAIEVFTLDTGRLPGETHDVIRRARARYRIDIRVYTPDEQAVDAYVRTSGLNAFYQDVGKRRACCAVRKVAPLARALRGKRAWITGPLVEWTSADVWTYIRAHRVPYNELHERGYPSIGCQPCSRAILPGEALRAGRWWWEKPGVHKECGLHVVPIRTGETEPSSL